MKKYYKIYLIENMENYSYDILNNAVIYATCMMEAKHFCRNRWPELKRLEIIELDQKTLSKYRKISPEDCLLCESVLPL